MQPETLAGLRLAAAAVVGMAAFLLIMGAGLWAFSPDLEDGIPPPNTRWVEFQEPIGIGVGMGVRAIPPRPPDAGLAPPADAAKAEDKTNDGSSTSDKPPAKEGPGDESP